MILPFQTVNHACDKLRVCRTVSTFPVVSKHHALLSDISLFPARMNGMPDCMLYSAGARPTLSLIHISGSGAVDRRIFIVPF